MEKTENYGLDLYELNDNGNLVDGYNASMRTIDTALEKQATDLDDALPITSENLATGAVTTDKISNGAVNSDKIATAAITSTKLATGAVTGDAIAAGAVTSEAIADGAITSDMLSNNISVNGHNIKDDSIPLGKLRQYSVNGSANEDMPELDSNIYPNSLGTRDMRIGGVSGSVLEANSVPWSSLYNPPTIPTVTDAVESGNTNVPTSDAVYTAINAQSSVALSKRNYLNENQVDSNFNNCLIAYTSSDLDKMQIIGVDNISLEDSDWLNVSSTGSATYLTLGVLSESVFNKPSNIYLLQKILMKTYKYNNTGEVNDVKVYPFNLNIQPTDNGTEIRIIGTRETIASLRENAASGTGGKRFCDISITTGVFSSSAKSLII